ncbi:MAG: hypothetical protein ACLQDY_20030, partial [Streptosporangiaceae bacterium]
MRELAMQALSSVEGGYDLLAPKFDHTPFRTPDGSDIAAGSAYPVPTAAAHASLIPDGTSLGEKGGPTRWNLISHPWSPR